MEPPRGSKTRRETDVSPRRPRRRAEARRRRILESAYESFGLRRYEDVTLADVAARAGTSERTVYRLFGTKERLVSSWLSEIRPSVAPPPDPGLRNDTHAFVRVMTAFYEERGASILNILAQEDVVPALRPLMAWGRDLYDEALERGLGHLLRGFRGAARQRRRMLLVMACDVYTWKLLRHGRGLSQGEAERVIEDLLDILEKAEPGA